MTHPTIFDVSRAQIVVFNDFHGEILMNQVLINDQRGILNRPAGFGVTVAAASSSATTTDIPLFGFINSISLQKFEAN